METITYHNYFTASQAVMDTINENPTLKKGHDFFGKVTKNGTNYTGLDNNPQIKKVVMKHIDLLNQAVKAQMKEKSGPVKKKAAPARSVTKAKKDCKEEKKSGSGFFRETSIIPEKKTTSRKPENKTAAQIIKLFNQEELRNPNIVSEIGKKVGIPEAEVVNWLISLERKRQLTMLLKSWIEQNVDSKVLYKGVEFFKSLPNVDVADAANTTGTDIKSMVWSKAYLDIKVPKLEIQAAFDKLAKKKPATTRKKPAAKRQNKSGLTPKKERPEKVTPKLVGDRSLAVRLIRRAFLMDGKDVKVKSLINLLNAIQRAANKGLIAKSKTTPARYDALKDIETRLIKLEGEILKTMNQDSLIPFKFGSRTDWKKYRKISLSEKTRPSVLLLNRFIGLQGKAPDKEKVKRLHETIQKALAPKGSVTKADPFRSQVEGIEKKLKSYLDGKGEKVSFSKSTLNGISFLGECNCNLSGLSESRGPITYQYQIWQNNDEDFFAEVIAPCGTVVFEIATRDQLRELQDRKIMGHAGSQASIARLEAALKKAGILHRGDKIVSASSQVRSRRKGGSVSNPGNTSLSGLDGYLIPPPVVNGKPLIVDYPSDNPPNDTLDLLGFEGDWKELFGNPPKGFNVMIHAAKKQGKSSLMLQFAQYLAANFGTVWYAAIEEGLLPSFTEKRQRLKIGHPDLIIRNYLTHDLSGFDFVIIDSVNRGGLKPKQVQDLMNEYPDVSFLLIFQHTKAGSHRGSEEWAHDVDVVVTVEDKVAYAVGRFGDGELSVEFGSPNLHTR